MTTANSAARTVEWLYNEIPITAQDRHRLRTIYEVQCFQDLVSIEDRLERHDLDGISDTTHVLLTGAIKYLDSLPYRSGNPLAHFNKFQYILFLKKNSSKMSDANLGNNVAKKMGPEYVGSATAKCSSVRNPGKPLEADKEDFMKEPTLDDQEEARKGDLFLALQGIGSGSDFSVDLDAARGSRPENRVSSFELNGVTYEAGKCYTYPYKMKDGSCSIVGIKYINPLNATAKCVMVIEESKTFLGELAPSKAAYRGLYVQVQADISPLPISNFIGEYDKQPKIPKTIFFPQSLGSLQTFGYFQNNDGRNRIGLRSSKLRIVELYSGAGGSHRGYKHAGFETAAVVELDETAMATFRKNNPDVPRDRTFNEKAETFVERYKTDEAFRKHIGPVDLLHGSPPCQGFSGANVFGGENDERNRKESLTCLEAVLAIQPNVFVYENVVGIWCQKHKDYIYEILTELRANDYQVFVSVVRSCSYGSAQKRPRFIIVAAKSHIPLSPCLLLDKPYGEEPNQLPFVTCKAILEPLRCSPEAAAAAAAQHAQHQDDVPERRRTESGQARSARSGPGRPQHRQHFALRRRPVFERPRNGGTARFPATL